MHAKAKTEMPARTSAGRTLVSRTLVNHVWPGRDLGMVRSAILVVLGTCVLVLSAKAKVPFYPVPMTLQTLAIAVIAASSGARLATATVVLYLLEGLAGFPVFTNTPPAAAGLSYMLGPTGGYLLGFVFSAAIIGTLADNGWGRSLPRLFVAMLAGDIAIFICGVAWLAWFAVLPSAEAGIGLAKALTLGFYPFLLGALVKECLGAALIRGTWTLTREN